MEKKRYEIIYEDQYLIVVNKPSGLLVIPTPNKEPVTLTSLLNEDLDRRGIEANAYPCHRIDRGTSGLVIYAKGKKAQQLMMEEFRSHSVRKRYIAFVQGVLRKNLDTIKSFIYNRNKRRVEPAVTAYRVIERRKAFTVVEVEPVTGRTNQIRIHFKGLGHPLVGEDVYAFRRDFKLRFKRLALHAASLEFTHPVTKENLSLSAPLWEEMNDFLEKNKE
ncbi:MAG: RluA family pseudouridine synthase [Candidatus Omnitrophota bacterium]